MIDLAKLLLRLIYYQSRLLGVLNIEIDLRTGRARRTRFAMVQAMIMNILSALCLLPLFQNIIRGNAMLEYTKIQKYFFTALLILRLSLTYLAVFTQFWNRHRLVRLINLYRRLARKKRPRVVRLWRRGIICKCLVILFMQIIQYLVVVIHWFYDYENYLTILVTYLTYIFFDLITFQYYFVFLNGYAHYLLLNWELRQLLAEMMTLESLKSRPAAFMIKCCSLADRLEAIAEEQSQLQALVDDLTALFGPQSLCVCAGYYIYQVTLVFFTYNFLKHHKPSITWNPLTIGLLTSKVMCHLLDMYITNNMAYVVLDQHSEMVNMLSDSTLGLLLDERLEAVYESFVLQLACNPLRLCVLGAFNIDRRKVIIILSSVISHSIVLLECDIENFRAMR